MDKAIHSRRGATYDINIGVRLKKRIERLVNKHKRKHKREAQQGLEVYKSQMTLKKEETNS